MLRIAPFLLFVVLTFGSASAVFNVPNPPPADRGAALQFVTQNVAQCHKVCAQYQYAAYSACRKRCASGETGQYNSKVIRHQNCLNSVPRL